MAFLHMIRLHVIPIDGKSMRATRDAMGCQCALAEQIVDANADYIKKRYQ